MIVEFSGDLMVMMMMMMMMMVVVVMVVVNGDDDDDDVDDDDDDFQGEKIRVDVTSSYQHISISSYHRIIMSS